MAFVNDNMLILSLRDGFDFGFFVFYFFPVQAHMERFRFKFHDLVRRYTYGQFFPLPRYTKTL